MSLASGLQCYHWNTYSGLCNDTNIETIYDCQMDHQGQSGDGNNCFVKYNSKY